MSDYTVPARRRSRSLLIVEGNYEKELYRLIFKAFPELNIDIDDVWIYETNIYELYNDIVKAYGDDWAGLNGLRILRWDILTSILYLKKE